MFSNLNKFGFDEQAVSPVVGVILMVAITVILAAVIGTFVLDLGGQVQQNAQAGVSFDDDGSSVDVRLNSVQNADRVYVQVGGSQVGDDLINASGGGVGTTTTVPSGSYTAGDKVTVIGVLDGNENIIQTHTMEG